MSDWDNDPHEGTAWAKDPHRGTVWSNNPHEGTVWDNRYGPRQPANETWGQRVERGRQGGSPASSNSGRRSGLSVPTIILFLIIFNIVAGYGYSALAGSIAASTAGSETLRHSLLSWLALMFYMFMPLATVILFINLVLRRYWSGVVLIIVTGILSFIGTGVYLVVTGVFFGR